MISLLKIQAIGFGRNENVNILIPLNTVIKFPGITGIFIRANKLTRCPIEKNAQINEALVELNRETIKGTAVIIDLFGQYFCNYSINVIDWDTPGFVLFSSTA